MTDSPPSPLARLIEQWRTVKYGSAARAFQACANELEAVLRDSESAAQAIRYTCGCRVLGLIQDPPHYCPTHGKPGDEMIVSS